MRLVADRIAFFLIGQKRRIGNAPPQRFPLRRQPFDTVDIVIELQVIAKARAKPAAERLGRATDQRQHRQPVKARLASA